MLLGDWHDRYPGVAVAAGLAVAALAGAAGGIWSGLAVAGAGWTFTSSSPTRPGRRCSACRRGLRSAASPARWRRAACARRGSAALSRASSPRCATPPPKRSSGSIPRGRSSAGTRARRRSAGLESGRGGRRDRSRCWRPSPRRRNRCDPPPAARLGERLDVPSTVHRHKNGDELAVSLTVAPIPNGADEPTGAVVVTRDIGEPQRAETRQRESEAKYRALTEHLPTITYVHPLGERSALYVAAGRCDPRLRRRRVARQAQPLLPAGAPGRPRARLGRDRRRVGGARPLRCEYRMLSGTAGSSGCTTRR